MTVHPAKTQIRLGGSDWASAQSDQSSLCAQWVAKDPNFLHVDSEDSDQTERMPRLIRVFARCTCHFVGFVMRWLNYCVWVLWYSPTYTPLAGALCDLSLLPLSMTIIFSGTLKCSESISTLNMLDFGGFCRDRHKFC